MNRITSKQLDSVILRLNEVTNSPTTYFNNDNNNSININHYTLSGAYGGWKLERVMNTSGGVDDVFSNGYMSKRELYFLISAYIKGIMSERSTIDKELL